MKVKRWEKVKHFLSYRLSIGVCNFTFQLYWGKIIKYNCKIFKVCNLMVWYMYKLWKYSPHGVNKSITSHVYFFFWGGWEHLSSLLLASFHCIIQNYYELYSSYTNVTSSDFIHLITENVYSFTNLSLYPCIFNPNPWQWLFYSLLLYDICFSDYIFISDIM